MKKNFLLLIFTIHSLLLFSQQGIIWSTTAPDFLSIDSGPFISFDGDGNIIAFFNIGSSGENTGDIGLVKLTADGELLWQAIFDGDSSLNDEAQAIAIDLEGNIYLTGTTWVNHFEGGDLVGTEIEVLTLKYSKDGDLIWHKTIPVSQWYDHTNSNSIVVDSSGNCYITGVRSLLQDSHNRQFLTKYDEYGNVIWDIVQLDDNIEEKGLHLTYLGDSIRLRSLRDNLNTFNREYVTTIFDIDGNQLFQNSAIVTHYPIILVENTNGQSFYSGGYYDHFAIESHDGLGEKLWNFQEQINQSPGTTGDKITDMATDINGNIYATGKVYFTTPPQVKMLSIKLNKMGEVAWKNLNGIAWEGKAIDADEWGNALVGSHFYVNGFSDIIILKYDTMGNKIGEILYQDPSGGNDFISDLKVYDNQSFIVAGESNGLMIQKYDIVLSLNEPIVYNNLIYAFPNPATDKFEIKLPEVIGFEPELQIYNALGHAIKVDNVFTPHKYTLDVSDLEGGIYFINIIYEGRNFTGKFIIVSRN